MITDNSSELLLRSEQTIRYICGGRHLVFAIYKHTVSLLLFVFRQLRSTNGLYRNNVVRVPLYHVQYPAVRLFMFMKHTACDMKNPGRKKLLKKLSTKKLY